VRQGLWSCSGCNDPDLFGWMVPIIRIQIPNFGPNERQEAGLIYDEIYSIHVLMYSTDVRQKIILKGIKMLYPVASSESQSSVRRSASALSTQHSALSSDNFGFHGLSYLLDFKKIAYSILFNCEFEPVNKSTHRPPLFTFGHVKSQIPL
jgi:hypothetical protein